MQMIKPRRNIIIAIVAHSAGGMVTVHLVINLPALLIMRFFETNAITLKITMYGFFVKEPKILSITSVI